MLSGQFDLSNATETVAIPNDKDIASFTDTNLSDTASSFTASIDWGDGATSTGTIVGSNGHFTVEGGHTYSDENQFSALVTVTRTADMSQLLIAGTVPVADDDNFTMHATTITYTPNTPLTNVMVATFTDTNAQNVAGDFTAQIDWGDGTTTTGTVQGSNGSFSIVGSHTYTAAGENTVSVSIADDAPDAATGFVTSTAVSGFGGQVTLTSATEGTALSGIEVASFADTTGSHVAGDYTATIDWGDGSTSPGTVSGSGQSFTVTGSHTYTDEEGDEGTGAPPDMVVSITRTADSVSITASGTVAVADADFLTMTSKTVGTTPNTPLTNVTVATFTDPFLANVAGDFTARIDWGDGSDIDIGTVSGSNGSFTVTGSHTYTSNGQDNISVSILDDVPNQGQIGAVTSKVIVGVASGDFLLTAVNEGDGNSHNVATFNDGNTGDTASAFTASIDWGDGTTTSGTISGGSGSFTVSGFHAYADEGDETPIVTVTRTADQQMVTMSGTVSVGEADALLVAANNISGNPGKPFTNIPVATFTTSFAGNVAGDFTATIDWGDGTTSTGTIVGSAGTFTVRGSHTYTTGGDEIIEVTVSDDAPGTAIATGTGSATINFAGQVVLTNATEGTALPNSTPVATFNDSNGGDTAASFMATIEWGDGVTSAGTVSGGAGTFTVSGGHTYADEGSDTAKVVLTHTADGATSTVSGGVSVAEADMLTGHPVSFTAHAHQAFSGTVATFDDTFAANVPGDFVATIDWGDGTITGGTVSGGSGSFTVSGSHTYASLGQDTVTVRLTDDAPGTATATATTTVNVAAPIVPKNDFNGDRTSDLLFQEVGNPNGANGDPLVGTPQIWLVNNTIVTSQTVLSNPGSTWSIAGTGDFNGDLDADLLLRNAATGDVRIWEMNGTSVAVDTTVIAGVPAAWVISGVGDFNGDGSSDILWRNTSTGEVDTWFINNGHYAGGTAVGFVPSVWQVAGIGDFNGDGTSDILWRNTSSGEVDMWFINNGQHAGGTGVGFVPSVWQIAGTGDFNGDGTSDILFRNTSTGEVDNWLIQNGHFSGGANLGFVSSDTRLVGTGDYNGDSKADILLQKTDGTPQIWTVNATGTSVIATTTLANPGQNWHAITG